MYEAVEALGWPEDIKAEFYAHIAEVLVPEMRLDEAQAAIELAISKVEQ